MIPIFVVISFLLLIVAELFYIPIARRNNWTSERNKRGDGHSVTVIGGGFIFYVAILLYLYGVGWLYESPQTMANMFIGITMLAACSFFDDLLQLKVWIRLVVHFIAVVFLVFHFSMFEFSALYVVLYMIFAVGIINGYNFMDGINGLTALYSISVLSVFLWINLHVLHFTSGLFILFALMSVFVFAYFNFRKRAIVFAGDVGSICMGYIIVTILTSYILATKEISAIVFIIVYIVDIVSTIIRRIFEKENIFRPHHKHIYQLLNRQLGYNQLVIAIGYSMLQIAISLIYLHIPQENRLIYLVCVSVVLLIGYIVIASISYLKMSRRENIK